MRYFRQVMSGIDVQPLLAQIAENPKLWTRDGAWTDGKRTVLARVGTGMAAERIELRYNSTPAGLPQHPKYWNRPAWLILTEAVKLIAALQFALGGVEILGRAIISKMAPGEVIAPHVHEVQFGLPPIFDTYQVPLQVDPGVVFRCGDEDCDMRPGSAWTFPNLLAWGSEQRVEHAVYNNSSRDRISMMIDIRPLARVPEGQ
jgi:hypothetical protein